MIPQITNICKKCRADLQPDDLPHLAIPQLGSILSDEDDPSIKSYIEVAERKIGHYDEEITRLMRIVDDLRGSRSALRQSVLRRRAAFCTVNRRTPVEVLLEIFSWVCLEFSLDAEPSISASISTPTLILSHVCSYWRNIVSSTPVLWSRLRVNLGNAVLSPDLVDHYLRCSSPVSLVINISAHESDLSDYDTLSPKGWSVLLALLSESSRWRAASCDIPWTVMSEVDDRISDIGAFCDRPLERLSSLEITWGYEGASPTSSTPFFNLLRKTPALSSLHIEDYQMCFPFQIDRLRRVNVGEINLYNMAELFRRSPGLEDATLRLRDHDSEVEGFVPEITCVTLHSLFIWFYYAGMAAKTISTLTLPNLTYLSIGGTFVDCRGRSKSDPPFFTHFQNMLSRSSCRLQKLRVLGCPFNSKWMLGVLSLLPELSHLELDGSIYYHPLICDDLIRNLALEPSSSSPSNNLLPQLKSLSIYFADVDYDEDDEFESDYFEREWTPPKLPSLDLIYEMISSRRKSHSHPVDSFSALERFELRAQIQSFLKGRLDSERLAWVRSVHSDSRLAAFEGLELSLDVCLK